MPRKRTGDDEAPRRRRAAAVEPGRRLALRILLDRPKDVAGGLVAVTACSAIIANSLFMQNGPHPAPMFGSAAAPTTVLGLPNPLPRPRPADADVVPLEPRLAEPKLSESRLFDPKPAAPKPAAPRPAEQRSADQETNSAPPPANVPRPPASVPLPAPLIGSRRVAAVQRALTEYGYGQLKPTGTIGSDTKAAIEKFERERKMPVTGQVSERLVHELGAVIGHSVD